MENEGYLIHYIAIDSHGVLNMDQFQCALNQSTALIVIQLVNFKTGDIRPIQIKLCQEIKRKPPIKLGGFRFITFQ